MKVIIDTNIMASGVFWSGPPRTIVKAWLNDELTPIVSEEIFNEYDRVLNSLANKSKFKNLDLLLSAIQTKASWCSPVELNEAISRDPDDDKFIACALSAKAKIIISGDKDLLVIGKYRNIEILNAKAFINHYLNKQH